MEQGTGGDVQLQTGVLQKHCTFIPCLTCCLVSQIGPSPRSPYTVLANGSLLLQPLSKDHHGGWECLATNRVATVSAGTVVMVLGEWANPISSLLILILCVSIVDSSYSTVCLFLRHQSSCCVLSVCHH